MKKRNLVLSLLLVSTILTSTLTPALAVEYGAELNPTETTYTQVFSDVPEDHWAFEMVMELEERGAINGYPDGKFYPDNTVNREAFSKIMVVAAGLTVSAVDSTVFSDVSADYWAAPYIVAAQSYMTAYQSSSGEWLFKPSDNALREDVAVAIVKLKGYDTRLADLSILTTMFSDVDTISTAAQPYVALAVENGLISGYTDGTFRGQATITRAEAATILWRAFQYGSDNKVIADDITALVTTEDVEVEVESETVATEEVTTEVETETTVAQEDVLPYVVDTVVTANIATLPSHITMNDTGSLIYYDSSANTIYSIGTGTKKAEVIVDVDQLKYTDDASSSTYIDFDLEQVFWDDVASRLLVVGKFDDVEASEDGWSNASSYGDTLEAIFSLDNGELELLWEITYSFNRIMCALSNGNYVVYDTNSIIIYNFETATEISDLKFLSSSTQSVRSCVQAGQNIYLYEFDLSKYDSSTGKWTTAIETSDIAYFINVNTWYQNGYFYNWKSGAIRVYQSDGSYKTAVDLNNDVLVMDFMSLPSLTDSFFVTEDEHYFFYDKSAKVIRMMYPNPDA